MTDFTDMSIAEQVRALGGPGRGGGTRRVAQARARVSGKSVKTEMRAVQRAMKTGKAPAKQSPQVARAGAAKARANQVRTARRVHVGQVAVIYPTRAGVRGEGTRDLGSFEVSGELAGALEEAAGLMEEGRAEEAQELVNEALLNEYGDLGGTLDISDFIDGLRFE